ncbi:MAG: transporter substrate-binding domain-containing protein [Bacteroidia bacterium]|nr:transporter substrate-binding domain-containing protein [Bacteroidia bacterium]MDW8347576.1 transporter substrate-binding domain-containing protein [Bacteroidia bacterium]
MKTTSFIIYLLSFIHFAIGQLNNTWTEISTRKSGTITVHYLEQRPFCYKEKQNGKLTGIEIDIMQEFVKWLKNKKEVNVKIEYKPYNKFNEVYETVKNNKDAATFGLATVTVTPERMRELDFSAPYLKNKSLMVSHGQVPTIAKIEELPEKFANLTAITVKNSVHEHDIQIIKQKYLPNLNIEYVDLPKQVIEKIASDKRYFGYLDLLTYWDFVKNNPKVYVKIHRSSIISNENFAFILPKGSDWTPIINEFFEAGFGFTATKMYRSILENHLGFEVISTVELY